MTRDDERLQNELQPFIAALRAELDDRISARVYPNSAEGIDEDDLLLASSPSDDDATAIGDEWQTLAQSEPELVDFVADLRIVLNERLQAPALVAPAHVAAIVPLQPRRPAWRRYAALYASAAAAVLVVILGATQFRALTSSDNPHFGQASLASQHLDHEDPRVAIPSTTRVFKAEPQPDDRTDTATVNDGTEAIAAATTELVPEPPPANAGESIRHDPPTNLVELNQRAREAWQAGDLATASRLLHKIIARARNSEAAQAAYADLFALARQQDPLRQQIKIWRAYLRDFPNGRYAQDARAGICHNTPSGAGLACWRDYLRHHPQGTHRASAEAALSLSPSH